MNVSIFGTFGWKTPIHVYKIEVFGQFDPWNGLQYQWKPKTHTLRESASFEPSSVKIWRAVWPVGESLKGGIIKKILVMFHLFAPEPQWRNFHQILHNCKSRRRKHLRQIFWRSVKGRRFCGGSKMEGSHWLSHRLLILRWRDCAASDEPSVSDGDLYTKDTKWTFLYTE